MEKTYYLYRHIRHDKNQVFYVGIGTLVSEELQKKTGSTFKAIHRRAYDRVKSRNQHWKNIVAITDFTVEIMLHTNDIELIAKKEIEFISLHKKTLCNLTEGGLGITSYSHTAESKAKIAIAFSGKKLTADHIAKANQRKFKPVIMYRADDTLNKEVFSFQSLSEAAIHLGGIHKIGNISSCLLGLKNTAYGYKFEYQSVESQDKELAR
jgi:hypothetical protein